MGQGPYDQRHGPGPGPGHKKRTGPAHGPRVFCGCAQARAHVVGPMDLVLCPLSYVVCPMSHVLCPMSYVLWALELASCTGGQLESAWYLLVFLVILLSAW